MKVEFKCKCMKEPKTIECDPRNPNEDLMDFMEYLQKRIGIEHRRLSLICTSLTMEYVKVPVDETKGVGFEPTKQ